MAYDAESDRIILFGGGQDFDADFGDTWAYDFNTNTWTQMSPIPTLTARGAMEMVYNAESDRIILFGGCRHVGGCDFNDTWAYDYNNDTWTRMTPSTAPPGRHAARGAYDSESDRFILVGGHQGGGEVRWADTWAYDFNNDTWTNVTPTGFWWASYASVAYDAGSDRVVHFSGERDAGFVPATWSYDYNANLWMDRNPPSRPPGQWIQDMDYDSESDRIVLVGQISGSAITWAYNVDTNEWMERIPSIQPSGRSGHRVAYDAESDRLVHFGGCLNLLALCVNETWAYDFNADQWTPLSPLTLPDAPRTLEASSSSGQVSLTWLIPVSDGGYPITNYGIYRGPDSGSLSFLDEVDSSFAYTDSSVTVGSTYLYEVRAVTMAGDGPPSNAASVTVPDDLNPTVTITSPTEGETVNTSSITASGTATDNVAVETVEVSTDGSAWTAATMGDTSWSASLDLEEGLNTIHARAIDTSANDAATSVSVTYRPPTSNGPDGGFDPLLIAGIIGGVAVAAVAVGVFLFRRRS